VPTVSVSSITFSLLRASLNELRASSRPHEMASPSTWTLGMGTLHTRTAPSLVARANYFGEAATPVEKATVAFAVSSLTLNPETHKLLIESCARVDCRFSLFWHTSSFSFSVS
jgi:hypothetical protein